MNRLSLLLFVFCSGSFADVNDLQKSLSKAPVVWAAVESIETFQLDFELIGFRASIVDFDAEVSVFVVDAPNKVKDSNFSCYFTMNDSRELNRTFCDALGSSNTRDYVSAKGRFSVEDFKQSAVSAVALFERAIGNPSKIHKARFWRSSARNEPNIQVEFTWLNEVGNDETNYLYCHNHRHGDRVEIDCHRQRSAGPFQP